MSRKTRLKWIAFIQMFFFIMSIITWMPFGRSVVYAAGTAPAGDGSSTNPYQVASENNLIWIRDQVNNSGNKFSGKYFTQKNDITLTAVWVPIGDANCNTEFDGIYDGDMHFINNMQISGELNFAGLFGYCNSAAIKNVKVSGTITINRSSDWIYAGGICASAMNTTITNCSFSGSISNTNTYEQCFTGGIAGSFLEGSVSSCYNEGNITGSAPGNPNIASTSAEVGGIVGQLCGGTISNCYNKGICSNINGTSDSCFVGGIVGDAATGSGINSNISNCYNVGSIKMISSNGLINGSSIGSIIGGSINMDTSGQNTFPSENCINCYFLQDTVTVSGLGINTKTYGSIKSDTEMKMPSTFIGWQSAGVWVLQSGQYPILGAFTSPAPTLTTSTLSGDRKKVFLNFNENVANALTDLDALKGAITLSTNGTDYNSLQTGDSVDIVDEGGVTAAEGILAITFNNALSASTNKIKMSANALKSAANGAKTNDIVTETIDATPVNLSLDMSDDPGVQSTKSISNAQQCNVNFVIDHLNPGVSSLQFIIKYDPAVIKMKGITQGILKTPDLSSNLGTLVNTACSYPLYKDAIPAGSYDGKKTEDIGYVQVMWASPTGYPVKEEGTYFTLQFDIVGTGNSNVEIIPEAPGDYIGDTDGISITSMINNGSFTIKPSPVTNITLVDNDSNEGIDGKDFIVGFTDSANSNTDVSNYKIYLYKDGQEPADKSVFNALTASNKQAVKSITRTGATDGIAANLGSGVTTDSKGQPLVTGAYWAIVTAVDEMNNYSFAKAISKTNITSDAAAPTAPTEFKVNQPVTADNSVNDDGKSSVTVTWTDSTTTTVNHYEIVAKAGSAPTVSDTVEGNTNVAKGKGTATFDWKAGDNLYVGVVAVDANGLKTLCGGTPANVIVAKDGHASMVQVAMPSASIIGEVAAGSTVELSCSTPGATIYYTTDGSTPTTGSTSYSAPIKVNSAMTIKAIAVKVGMIDSSVMSESYIVAYKLTYMAGSNGTISGNKVQTVISGAAGSAITAKANAGYHFVYWSDGVTTAIRVDRNVVSNINVTAFFAADIVKTPINNLTATAGDGEVFLNFDAPTGATNVEVEQSIDGVNYEAATTSSAITAVSTTAEVIGLNNGQEYNFRLLVTGGFREGVSNVASAIPLATTPSAVAIDDLTATAGDGEVTLQFSAPTGATNVIVEQSIDGVNYETATTSSAITASSASAKVTELTNGRTYSFRIIVIGGIHEGTSNIATATPMAANKPKDDTKGGSSTTHSTPSTPSGGGGTNKEEDMIKEIVKIEVDGKTSNINGVNQEKIVTEVKTAIKQSLDDIEVKALERDLNSLEGAVQVKVSGVLADIGREINNIINKNVGDTAISKNGVAKYEVKMSVVEEATNKKVYEQIGVAAGTDGITVENLKDFTSYIVKFDVVVDGKVVATREKKIMTLDRTPPVIHDLEIKDGVLKVNATDNFKLNDKPYMLIISE